LISCFCSRHVLIYYNTLTTVVSCTACWARVGTTGRGVGIMGCIGDACGGRATFEAAGISGAAPAANSAAAALISGRVPLPDLLICLFCDDTEPWRCHCCSSPAGATVPHDLLLMLALVTSRSCSPSAPVEYRCARKAGGNGTAFRAPPKPRGCMMLYAYRAFAEACGLSRHGLQRSSRSIALKHAVCGVVLRLQTWRA